MLRTLVVNMIFKASKDHEPEPIKGKITLGYYKGEDFDGGEPFKITVQIGLNNWHEICLNNKQAAEVRRFIGSALKARKAELILP